MKIVDTNYLVRLFTNQPKDLASKALDDIRESSPASLLLSDFVISELVYVLEFHDELAYDRKDITVGLRLILSHPAWKLDDELHNEALSVYEASKLDYVDCLVVAFYKLERAEDILTFDKALKKQM
jgi:predicted nucleic-acid-binding protein